MLYCDKCGTERSYVIQEKKIKGSCEICNVFAGPCNEADSDDLFNHISSESLDIVGFKMNQIKGFPVKQKVSMIEPESNHKTLTHDVALFFRKNSVVFANIKTGKRVEVHF